MWILKYSNKLTASAVAKACNNFWFVWYLVVINQLEYTCAFEQYIMWYKPSRFLHNFSAIKWKEYCVYRAKCKLQLTIFCQHTVIEAYLSEASIRG